MGDGGLDLLAECVGADAAGEADPGEDPCNEVVVEELPLEVVQLGIRKSIAKLVFCLEKLNLCGGRFIEVFRLHFTK